MARILIVDDSAVMRRNLRLIFEGAGHEVVCEATNGKEAFQAYQKHKPDLVTMDISMPDVDGVEGVKMIIKDYPDANIVMITAFSQKSMVYEAIKSGAKSYIVKPINLSNVKEVVDEVLINGKEG